MGRSAAFFDLDRTLLVGASGPVFSAALLNLDPDQLLTTTRSVRKRLDLERPVERKVIEECLDVALQAPTGSNRQGWHWVFVTDPDKKQFIADRYNDTFRMPGGYAEKQKSGPGGRGRSLMKRFQVGGYPVTACYS